MDKKRAAMRQIKAIEAHSERLAAIEQALTAPVASTDTLEASEPLATAAQIAAIGERLAAIEQALTARAPARPTR